ncbi:hypothetical protein D3C75_124100 [compost metagenome]
MSKHVLETLDRLKRRLAEMPPDRSLNPLDPFPEPPCFFFRPATAHEFKEFEETTGIVLPEDYRFFLTLHNGVELFRDVHRGNPSWHIFGLDEIEDARGSYPTPDDYYVIAKHDQTLITVNVIYVKEGRNDYLFDSDTYSCTHIPNPINLNFEVWLERLIAADGKYFWMN